MQTLDKGNIRASSGRNAVFNPGDGLRRVELPSGRCGTEFRSCSQQYG